MQFIWLVAFYTLKAEEADERAANAEGPEVREAWLQIAQARRALAERLVAGSVDGVSSPSE